MMLKESPSSPSFSSHSSDSFPHIATRVVHELHTDPNHTSHNPNHTPLDQVDDDFEFSVFGHTDSSPVSADDIFFNGQIRPIYPLFNQNAVAHSSVPSLPVEMARPQRLPLRTLMLEERETVNGINELEGVPEGTYCVWTPPRKKTSSSPKRWRLRDLVHRSHGGAEKNSPLFASTPKRTNKVVLKHASTHNQNGCAAAKLVGLFTNANGFGRNNLKPFSN